MNEPSKFLLDLQLEIGFRIQSDPLLKTLPVLIRRKGVTTSDVQNALGVANTVTGLCGAVAIVMMPAVDNPEPESAGLQIDSINCVRVIEQPALNEGAGGIGISAEEISARILRLLHLWQIDQQTTVRSDKRPIVPANTKNPKEVAYDVFTRARFVLGGNTIVPPKIVITAGNVQISCNTAAVAIWYTLDGSYPIPGAGTAVQYDAPFFASKALIRAGAYKGDLLPSSIAKHWAPYAPPSAGSYPADSSGAFPTDSTGHFATT